MNFELERAVVLLSQPELTDADADELAALVETIATRWKDRPRYTNTRRGVHALERVHAADEKRDPDYAAAVARFVTANGKEPL